MATIPVENVIPYDKNAKKHPKKQVEQVAASIKEFGFNQPIVVDKDGVLIVGHGRLEAAKLLGLKEVPVIVADLTEEQAKAYRLADNKLNESDWDMNLVIEELKGLSEPMLDLTGFDSDLVIEADEKDDEVPEIPEEPQSKLGDLYELGNHRVLCGDSTNLEDVERVMDGKKADMVFTDPPYNVNYGGNNNPQYKQRTIENDNMTNEQFNSFCLDFYASYKMASKSGSPIYTCYSDKAGRQFRNAFEESGYHFSCNIIWSKDRLVLSMGDYHSQHEPILYGWLDGASHSYYGDRKQTTIWNMKRPTKSDLHPTMKPIELVEKALINSSKGEDVVLDLFLGSGSTLIASEKTGRICYGMELDPKYVDVIVQRYVDYTGDENVVLNGKKIVWKKKKTT